MASLRELYPTGNPSLEAHQELLHRHARKLETGIAADVASHERHRALVERVDDFEEEQDKKLDKIDREMSDQTQALTDIKLALAMSEGSTKRFQVWATILTPILAVLATVFANYMSKPPSGPGPVQLTPAQMQTLHEQEAAPKR